MCRTRSIALEAGCETACGKGRDGGSGGHPPPGRCRHRPNRIGACLSDSALACRVLVPGVLSAADQLLVIVTGSSGSHPPPGRCRHRPSRERARDSDREWEPGLQEARRWWWGSIWAPSPSPPRRASAKPPRLRATGSTRNPVLLLKVL